MKRKLSLSCVGAGEFSLCVPDCREANYPLGSVEAGGVFHVTIWHFLCRIVKSTIT